MKDIIPVIQKINQKWSKQEIDILIKNYSSLANKELSNILKRSVCAILNQAHKLGLHKDILANIKDKYGHLAVLSVYDKDKYSHVRLLCKCDCGNTCVTHKSSLTAGRTISCGCVSTNNRIKLKNDLTGLQFGKLTILYRVKNNFKYRHITYKAKCECGKCSIVSATNLISGATKSCGNCKLFRNGIPTSWMALELHNMIGRGEHNYFTDVILHKKHINVDIAIPEERIAIEYDEDYWHKDKCDQDTIRIKKLLDGNWNIIQIKASRNLPTQQQIDNALINIKNTNYILMDIR